MKPSWLHQRASHHQRHLSPIRKPLLWLLLCSTGLWFGFTAHSSFSHHDSEGAAIAQSSSNPIENDEQQVIRQFELPPAPPPEPVYQPQPAPQPEPVYQPASPDYQSASPTSESSSGAANTSSKPERKPEKTETASNIPTSQYVYEFNRDPNVGNRLRLQGTYAEARINFTRPRNWKVQSTKALIRFQHSPALLANRSNLTVRVNGTSIGSVSLNRKQSQTGQVLLNIPTHLLQNYNEITMVAQQQNSPTCSDPGDQTLWTEILPDSKLIFNYQPQPVALNFSQYPYPFFDELSLDANQIVYLLPSQMQPGWLTASARLQALMGRLADFRPIDTRLVKNYQELRWNDRLIVIGTPEAQPALKSLKLPYKIASNQILDGAKNPLPIDVGVLMLTTAPNSGVPVLVITGNGTEGVAKAIQALVQPQNRQLNTGQAVLVTDLQEVSSPSPREWSRYLPLQNTFQLSDLKGQNDKPLQDVTVRGAYTPPIEFDFRALPDDQFTRGSSMKLRYSYSPQINPRLSTVEVRLDGAPIGGQRLTSVNGANHKSLDINLPENLVKPNSKIQVAFNLSPREPGECGRVTDQQLWGTLHSDTSFKLNRVNSVQLPDLKLLQFGYPFAAPQDLSSTAIVLPDAPSNADVLALLEFSERLGRLSQANSVKLDVFTTGALPEETRSQKHLVGIGIRDKFPFPEVFEAGGFRLKNLFARQSPQGQVQTLPDNEGLIRQIVSPWNDDRVLLALSGQTESGLDKVRDLLDKDTLFFQLQEDTVLVNTNDKNPSAYDPNDYELKFLQKSSPRRIEQVGVLNKSTRFLQDYWFMLPTGIVVSALLLYGVIQLYLKRVTTAGGAK
jgi:cellulose synthase operon protein B